MEQFNLPENLPRYNGTSADEFLQWVYQIDGFYYDVFKNLDRKDISFLKKEQSFCLSVYNKLTKRPNLSAIIWFNFCWFNLKDSLYCGFFPNIWDIEAKVDIYLKKNVDNTIVGLYRCLKTVSKIFKSTYSKELEKIIDYKILVEFLDNIKCDQLKWKIKCRMPKNIDEALSICREFVEINGYEKDGCYFEVNNLENVTFRPVYIEKIKLNICQQSKSNTNFDLSNEGEEESYISDVANNVIEKESSKNNMFDKTHMSENQIENTPRGNLSLKREGTNFENNEINSVSKMSKCVEKTKLDKGSITTNDFRFQIQKNSENLNKNKNFSNLFLINNEESKEKNKGENYGNDSSKMELESSKNETKSSKLILENKEKYSRNEIQINNNRNFNNIMATKYFDEKSVEIPYKNDHSGNLAKNRDIDPNKFRNVTDDKNTNYNDCLKPIVEISSLGLKNYELNTSVNNLLSFQERLKFCFVKLKEKLIYKRNFIKKRISRYKFRKKVIIPKMGAKYKNKQTDSSKKISKGFNRFSKNMTSQIFYRAGLRKINNYCDYFDDKYIRKKK